MKIKNLQELLVMELRDLYSAEKQIVKALPRMARKVHSEELRQALEEHLEQTRQQITRLDQVFGKLGTAARARTCEGMKGVIREGEEILNTEADPDVLDAAVIGAAQKVEHYEIAGYGTARALAQELGAAEVADLLQQTLDEEGETDKKLTRLAVLHGINAKAESSAREDMPREGIEVEDASGRD